MLSQKDKIQIMNILDIICYELLDIDMPDVIFSIPEGVVSKTAKACVHVSDTCPPVMYISPELTMTPEIVLYLGHELRHIYQFNTAPEMCEKYQCSLDISLYEYNSQEMEIDAHAFGEICMIEIAKAIPLWQNFPDDIKEKIRKRKEQILRDEFDI